MSFVVPILLILTVVYAFIGVFSFIPYLLGLSVSVISFPITFFSNFYPVGILPRLCLYGIPLYLLVRILIFIFSSHTN